MLGFLAYLAYPALSEIMISLLPWLLTIDSRIVGGMLAGLATSFITVLVIAAWAYSTRNRRY